MNPPFGAPSMSSKEYIVTKYPRAKNDLFTVFVLRCEPNTRKRDASIGTYFRLVLEQDAESKRLAFEKALAELKAIEGA